jgi:hypothetical protein
MVTEFDESGPDSDVTRATLMESALTPGALALLPAGAAPVAAPVLPLAVLLDDEDFDVVPHPATNRTIASADPTRVLRRILPDVYTALNFKNSLPGWRDE